LQPHAPPQHPPLDVLDSVETEPLADFVPFPGAAKTEIWIVLWALEHFGHVTLVLPFITMRS